jgi:hypothetical protein
VGTHDNAVLVDEVQLLDRESLVLREGSVDRITVDALHALPAAYQELGEPACYDRFAHTAFALENQMNRWRDGGTVRDRRSISVRIVLGHNDFLSSNQVSTLRVAIVVNFADVHLRLR